MMHSLGFLRTLSQNQNGNKKSPRWPIGLCATRRRIYMQWQTPTATDLRFGFEITLYVSNR